MSSHDVVMTLAWETLADLDLRNWMRPPDRILSELLGDARVRRMAVVEPARNPLVALLRERGVPATVLPPAVTLRGRHVIRPSHFGGRRSWAPGGTTRRYRRTAVGLGRRVAALGMNRPHLVSTDPLLVGLADCSWAGTVTYYARDDWSAHPSYASLHGEIEKAYRGLRSRRVDVVAVSEQLLARLAPTGRSMHLRNAVEPQEWACPAAGDDAPGAAPVIADGGRPRAVYTGTLDTRLDLGWLAQIAVSGAVHLVLAGPVTDQRVGSRLTALPNTTLTGQLDRFGTSQLVRGAAICLVPHTDTPLTRTMDPLKLYEYLAAGKPVVATNLPPMRGFGERVLLVDDAGGRGDALERALAMPPADEDERKRFLTENSWAVRAEQLLDFITCR